MNRVHADLSLTDIQIEGDRLTGTLHGVPFGPADSVTVNDNEATATPDGALRVMLRLSHLRLNEVATIVVKSPNGEMHAEASVASLISTEERARIVGDLVPPLLHSAGYRKHYFSQWQEKGFHVTPVHFYQPIPDTRQLSRENFTRVSRLPGIDMRDAQQVRLVTDVFPRYREEYEAFPLKATDDPTEFYLENQMFERVDAQLFYCIIREFKPRRILEIGSGWSSLLAAKAAQRNGMTEIVSVDPFAGETLRRGVPGITLLSEPVQALPLSRFEELEQNDILFIDSSHVSKIGSDVNYLFLEILPRLRSGVIVHVHDIFLPFEYPPWHAEAGLFWTEQYLLQAFLIGNRDYTVLVSSAWMHHRHQEKLRAAFGRCYGFGGSFWMQRTSSR